MPDRKCSCGARTAVGRCLKEKKRLEEFWLPWPPFHLEYSRGNATAMIGQWQVDVESLPASFRVLLPHVDVTERVAWMQDCMPCRAGRPDVRGLRYRNPSAGSAVGGVGAALAACDRTLWSLWKMLLRKRVKPTYWSVVRARVAKRTRKPSLNRAATSNTKQRRRHAQHQTSAPTRRRSGMKKI